MTNRRETGSQYWAPRVLLGIVLVAAILAVVMVATGYVPLDGFGHNSAHSLHFGLDLGVLCGAAFGAVFWL